MGGTARIEPRRAEKMDLRLYLLAEDAAPPDPLAAAEPPLLVPPLLLEAALPLVPPLGPELEEADLPPPPLGVTTVALCSSQAAIPKTLNAANNT